MKQSGKVNSELEGVMKSMLGEVKKGIDKQGNALGFLDRLRILDRVLKWEAIKAKFEDSEWGSKFNTGSGE